MLDLWFFQAAWSSRQGVWWFRLFGPGLMLKASWNKPLFSERNGLRKSLQVGRGWRIVYLEPSNLTL